MQGMAAVFPGIRLKAYWMKSEYGVQPEPNQKFQQWKAGELDHLDMDEAIHQTHQQNQEVYGFFTLKRELLVRAIQLNEDWFQTWVKDNPPPAGYRLG